MRALFVVVAAISIGMTLPDTWSWIGDQRAEFGDYSERDRVEIAAFDNRIPFEPFAFFRQHVRRGDRFFVFAREGNSVRGVDFSTASRTFARYYLQPAILVDDPANATVVLAIGRAPAETGFRFKSILRGPRGEYAVARISDPT